MPMQTSQSMTLLVLKRSHQTARADVAVTAFSTQLLSGFGTSPHLQLAGRVGDDDNADVVGQHVHAVVARHRDRDLACASGEKIANRKDHFLSRK